MGGSPVGDGTLSLDGFNTSAAALVKRWKEIEVDDFLPDWTWKPCSKMGPPSEVEGYLALEGVYRGCGGSQEQIDENDNSDGADAVACDTWVIFRCTFSSLHGYCDLVAGKLACSELPPIISSESFFG